MTTIRRSATVPYEPARMFGLVDDIESYPDFLPWCRSTRIHKRDQDEVRATLELAWRGIRREFTTCNRLQQHKMIEVRLIEGPFRHLDGFWRFDTLDDGGCRVRLDMDFEFSNRMLGFAIGPVFNQIASNLVEAFRQRAHELYGR